MAKTRTYIVSFSLAERQAWGGYSIRMSLMGGGTNHRVEADSFAKLETEVRRLATEFGQTCSPYIRLPKGERNPPGFDAFCKTLNIIDYTPPAPTWIRITSDEWYDKLEVVPPEGRRANGFLCGEPQDHRGPNGDARYWAYAQRGDGLFFASTTPMTLAQWAAFHVATIVEVPAPVAA